MCSCVRELVYHNILGLQGTHDSVEDSKSAPRPLPTHTHLSLSDPCACTHISSYYRSTANMNSETQISHTIVVYVCAESVSCVQLFATPWTVAHQALPSMRFSGQGYWCGMLFPSPEDLPDPGIEPRSPALTGGLLTMCPPGSPTVA